jgi:ATP-dependent DNA helicase RecG
VGKITLSERTYIGKFVGTKIHINDGSGTLEAVFFRQPYLQKQFREHSIVALSGKVVGFMGKPQMSNPEHKEVASYKKQDLADFRTLMPFYSSTEGLAQRSIRTSTKRVMDQAFKLVEDFVPNRILKKLNLISLPHAIKTIHYPKTFEEADLARKRLAFDELFLYQLAAIRKKYQWRNEKTGIQIKNAKKLVEDFSSTLEFQLTNGQTNVLNELCEDMSSEIPMGRLLQGEVGSGKTVVALASLVATCQSGHQGAFMAPTEVLAEQHFINSCKQLEAKPYVFAPNEFVKISTLNKLKEPITIALLVGSFSEKVKKQIQIMIRNGLIQLVIGTHTLLQEKVEFKSLGMVIVDEQHRFGVEQRSHLSKKEPRPHLLAMSATPIPRTLALTVYGDLELSTIKELPRSRKLITTSLVNNESDYGNVLSRIREEVSKGRQAFIVCPFIEPSDSIPASAATTEYQRLNNGDFSDLRVGLLHGLMPLYDKQKIMDEVREKKIDVLIATPIIEVGVDIPNATVTVIMSAERFGLAQLHQLRGRVGRGKFDSYCFLVPTQDSELGHERLQILVQNSDGFNLSEEDLRIRGPGDYLGTKQSGWNQLKIATIEDRVLLQMAREEAKIIVSNDVNLRSQENEKLNIELKRITQSKLTEFF